MKLYLLVPVLFMLLSTGTGSSGDDKCSTLNPKWSANLRESGFRNFAEIHRGRADSSWERQEGVVFISDEELAVYQVMRATGAPALGVRDATGGASEFTLQVLFLNASTGSQIKSVNVPTSSEASAVVPLSHGKYLLQTGTLIRTFSVNFHQLALKHLSSSADATNSWRIVASPAKEQLYVEHHVSFGTAGFRIEGELLDPSTLQTITSFDATGMSLWPEGNSVLVGSRDLGSTIGEFSSKGGWKPLYEADWPGNSSCSRSSTFATSKMYLSRTGCNQMYLQSRSGTKYLALEIKRGDDFISQKNSEQYLAAEIGHHRSDPFDTGRRLASVRLLVINLRTKASCSIPARSTLSIWGIPALYAVSDSGKIAIIENDVVTLYEVFPAEKITMDR